MAAAATDWWVGLQNQAPRWRALLAIAWTVFAMYPNPTVLVVSIKNAWSPVIDPDAVREWARTLPRNPRAIENAVLTRIEYAVPWETDGVPWTFPTPAEVFARGTGDCQGRAVVLASTFEALGMPYRLEASFDHIWVDYPGRKGTGIERPERAFVRRAPTESGWISRLKLPDIDWAESWRIERDYFWDAAPNWRLALLVAGWVGIAMLPRILGRRVAPGRDLLNVATHRGPDGRGG
jgi:hypothetical protein